MFSTIISVIIGNAVFLGLLLVITHHLAESRGGKLEVRFNRGDDDDSARTS